MCQLSQGCGVSGLEEIEEIEFKQWTTTDHSTLQTIVQSTDEFIEGFLDKLETLRRHDFIAKQ